MYDPANEGIDHINAYSKSKTEEGRLLSNFARTPFQCCDGRFNSIEGYWYWLSVGTGHPRRHYLSSAYGWYAKKLGQEIRGEDYPMGNQFEHRIRAAIMAKVAQNPQVYRALRLNTLPIVHYYAYGEPPKIIVPKEGQWVWDFYNQLGKILKYTTGEQNNDKKY